jgi:hypothetical protein
MKGSVTALGRQESALAIILRKKNSAHESRRVHRAAPERLRPSPTPTERRQNQLRLPDGNEGGLLSLIYFIFKAAFL